MKRRFFALCLGLLLVGLGAAPALAQQSDAGIKYWIFLKDKMGPAGKVAAAAPSYVSERALQRRALRGTAAAPEVDAPLSAAYLDALRARGVAPLVESRWLNAVSAVLTEGQVRRVSGLPFVREVRPVGVAHRAPVPPGDAPARRTPSPGKTADLNFGPSFTQLAVINAHLPLERGINGAGVRLGILDTEFGDFQHPVFAKLVNEGRLVATKNFAQQSQINRHGLSVASVAVGYAEGNLIGPAYGAELLAATTEYAPTETNQEEDNFVAGLEWMEAQGADVVNVSLGYTEFDAGQTSYTYADLDGNTAVTTRAADLAAALGVVVVTSAGNEGCSSPANCWYYIGTPADGDSVITVGAVQMDSLRASFSSFGPTADGRTKPDVAAPGSPVRVAVPGDGYVFSAGTSFSSPLVAGVVCQMLQVNPALTPIEVRDILRSTAHQAERPDNALGWGIVNAEAALAAAQRLATGTDGPLPVAGSALAAPFPNPFTGRTTFAVSVPTGVPFAQLSVYTLLGRRVAVPFRGPLAPGTHRVTFDAGTLPAGVYLYALEGNGLQARGTLVLVR